MSVPISEPFVEGFAAAGVEPAHLGCSLMRSWPEVGSSHHKQLFEAFLPRWSQVSFLLEPAAVRTQARVLECDAG